jgi:hypothetical protein
VTIVRQTQSSSAKHGLDFMRHIEKLAQVLSSLSDVFLSHGEVGAYGPAGEIFQDDRI